MKNMASSDNSILAVQRLLLAVGTAMFGVAAFFFAIFYASPVLETLSFLITGIVFVVVAVVLYLLGKGIIGTSVATEIAKLLTPAEVSALLQDIPQLQQIAITLGLDLATLLSKLITVAPTVLAVKPSEPVVPKA